MYYIKATKDDFKDTSKQSRRCTPRKAALVLVSKSNLRYSLFYAGYGAYFLYNDSHHTYIEYNRSDFLLIVTKILDIVDYPAITDYDFVRKVVDNLGTLKNHAKIGIPEADPNFLVFNNCMYDLKTKTTKLFDPRYLVFSKTPFDYTESKEKPNFDEYLDDFCEGHPDRIKFVQCFLYTVLYGAGSMQLFFHFFGIGGTGKSTLANVAQCLVGKESCITTSLKRLSGDGFELINLVNKKFILIVENENWSEETSVLKSISGNDSLPGRKKHIQGSFEVNVSGVLAIFNNSKFNTRDESGAVQRRLKQFRADNQVPVSKDLIRYSRNRGWEGLLVVEIPAILNWVVELTEIEVRDFLNNISTSMPSFAEEIISSKLLMNPVLSWINDEIVPGIGLYIGIQAQPSVRNDIDARQRRTLYPAYRAWCDRQGIKPISRNKFGINAERFFKDAGHVVEIKRKECGQFIMGVDLKPNVFNLDYQQGSTMWQEKVEVRSDMNLPGYISIPSQFNPVIGPDLRNKYKELLGNTPLKEILNKYSKAEMTEDLTPMIVNTYLKSTKLRDPDFVASITKQISDGLRILRKKGGIPTKWTDCGVSPRLIPYSYGHTINFTKRVVRDEAYRVMSKQANKLGYVIVDLDITSCYLGILIGLCPTQLHGIRMIIEKSTIWEEIKRIFEEAGKGEMYDKSAVKVCVYASYFLGGDTAMRHGILENIRKATGLQERKFKESTYYEEACRVAVDVITQMRTSEIIAQFKDVSLRLKEGYLGQNLTGPTGDTWLVTEENWRKVYPNYLISFEIALLGKTMLNLVEAYPKVEVIGHYHDGCVLLIPTEQYDEVINFCKEEIASIGQQIGLQYPQAIEVKVKY